MNTKAPTVAEEMAKFSGFTTNNGETVPADKTKTGPGETDLSDDERAAGHKVAGGEARTAKGTETKTAPAAKVELTDAEAETALEKATSELGEGEELTQEEQDEVLAKALTEKRSKAKGPANADPNSRVKRAQEGRRRAEARAARAETKLTELEQRLAAVESGGKAPLTATTKAGNDDAAKEPDPKDFDLGELDPKYIRALVRYENEQADASRAQNQQKTQLTAEQQRAAAENAEKFQAFEEAGNDAYDDFQEVVMDTRNLPKSDPAAWPLSATVGRLLLDSEQGPQIAYMLASDPKEAKRVDKLLPAAQTRWFFQQEAKFSAEQAGDGGTQDKDDTAESQESKTPAARQITKAPPPPKRNAGGSGTRQPSAATTDFAAFEAMASQSAKPHR